jgi:Flp pilus assembly protein TadG
VSSARPGRTDGFVTAETAVVLPVLVVVTLCLLALVHAAGLRTVAQDAAAMGARTAARGEADARVRAAAARVAPAGGTVTVRRAGGLVIVDVRVDAGPAGPLGRLLGAWTVGARSVAADESAP